MQFEVEIVDTTARENYNKVVIHKKKCVPCGPDNTVAQRQRKPGEVLVSNNNNIKRPDVPQKPKVPPKVPPKPFLARRGRDVNTKLSPPALSQGPRVTSTQSSPPSVSLGPSVTSTQLSPPLSLVPRISPDPPGPPGAGVGGNVTRSDDNCNGHLKERLIEETKSIVEKNLLRERNELIVRMQKKVNFLKEDQAEIRRDLDDNGGIVSDIIERVKLEGSIIDADKLQLHIDELESVTNLMTVLRVRLKTTENKIEVTKDQREKDFLGNKVIKLSTQVQEAEQLRVFRRRRGDILFQTMSSYLDSATLSKLSSLLDQRASFRAEISEVEEKLHLALRQIEALKM